jgi:hypothetical protein
MKSFFNPPMRPDMVVCPNPSCGVGDRSTMFFGATQCGKAVPPARLTIRGALCTMRDQE